VPGRILVVDDVAVSARMLSAKLVAEYYDVVVAEDGPSALRLAEENDPDVILLDIMMPGMDGFEVCRQLKKNPVTAHTPVVMVTALTDLADRVRGLESGADDFLAKPVDDTALLVRVRSMIRLKRMLDQWRMREEITARLGFLAAPDSVPDDDGRQGRVFLIETSRTDGESMRGLLAAEHAHVVLCENAAEALGQATAADPDVIVIGLESPEASGSLRLVSQCRMTDATRYVPIVLVGGDGDSDHLNKGLEIGANDYIVRPVDEGEFKARIRSQVRRKRYNDRLQANFVRNLSLALTDPLTNLHNRRYFTTHLESVVRRAAISGKPASLLMIDVDHFKQVNDTYGHIAGDVVLREIAGIIARNVRGFDLSARYGGEEFAVMMPDTTSDIATVVADRLCERVAAARITVRGVAGEITTSVSIGIAQSRETDETPEALLKRADEALYEAKRLGRNRVVVAGEPARGNPTADRTPRNPAT
jgi:two-component system cell cycle response regulator